MIDAVSASSWRAAGAALRLTPPTITAWDYFRTRAKPLPRSPRRARGSPETSLKTSPSEADTPRLCQELAVGVDHGEADDQTQPAGPRNFVLRRDRYSPRLSWHHRPCDAVHGHPGLHRAQSRERGVYAHGQRPRHAYGHT